MKKLLIMDKCKVKFSFLNKLHCKNVIMILVFVSLLVTYCVTLNTINKLKLDNSNVITAYSTKLFTIQELYNNKLAEFKEIDEVKKEIEALQQENIKLKKLYDEVVEDNLHLQNSLKLAAKVGIKPQRYNNPPNITSRSFLDRSRFVGKFVGTAYTPSPRECSNSKGITYSGKPIIPGLTVAVDTHYWPIGTVFYIKGLGYVTAMDTGNKVKGRNRFDFAVFDRKFAYALGRKNWEVYLVKRGNGKVNLDIFENNQSN